MTLLPQTLNDLAALGARLRVDVRKLSPNQLQQLAAAVAEGGGTLTLVNAQALTPDQAKTLAAIAHRAIEFDAAA